MPKIKIDPVYAFVGIVVFIVVVWFIILPMFKSRFGANASPSPPAASSPSPAGIGYITVSGILPNAIKPSHLFGMSSFQPSLGLLGPLTFTPYFGGNAATFYSTTPALTPYFWKVGSGIAGSGLPGAPPVSLSYGGGVSGSALSVYGNTNYSGLTAGTTLLTALVSGATALLAPVASATAAANADTSIGPATAFTVKQTFSGAGDNLPIVISATPIVFSNEISGTVTTIKNWNNQFIFINYSASTFIHIEVRVPNFSTLANTVYGVNTINGQASKTTVATTLLFETGLLNTQLPFVCPYNNTSGGNSTPLTANPQNYATFNSNENVNLNGKKNNNVPLYVSSASPAANETSCTFSYYQTTGVMATTAGAPLASPSPAKIAATAGDIYCDYNLHLQPFGYLQMGAASVALTSGTGVGASITSTGYTESTTTCVPSNLIAAVANNVTTGGILQPNYYSTITGGSSPSPGGYTLYSKSGAPATTTLPKECYGAIRLPPLPSPWCIKPLFISSNAASYFSNTGWDGISNPTTIAGSTSFNISTPNATGDAYTTATVFSTVQTQDNWVKPICNTALYVYYTVPQTAYKLSLASGLGLPNSYIAGGTFPGADAGTVTLASSNTVNSNWKVRVQIPAGASYTVTSLSTTINGSGNTYVPTVSVASDGVNNHIVIAEVNNHYLFPLGAFTQIPSIGSGTTSVNDIIDTYGLRVFQVCDDILVTQYLPSTVNWGDLFLS